MGKKSRTKEMVVGPEVIEGELVAEDGGEVTPALQEIYDFDTARKEENTSLLVDDTPRELAQPKTQTAIIADTFNVPKACRSCYLQDKCNHFSEDAACHYQIQVNIDSPEDLMSLMKLLIEKQGERVLFGMFIERTEGGYVDRNLSEEMMRTMDMIERFKNVFTKGNDDEITVKVKGKDALQTAAKSGVLSQIFGGGDSKKGE